jgi:hypothetical protein
MVLDLYLSEMSVSDRHGGGLTLQRVLGEDLDRIKFFVHVHRFATDYPATDRLKSRCLDLFTPFGSDAVRRKIGCRPAKWLSERRMLRVWQGKRVAKAIAARFAGEKRPLRALVCPQSTTSLYAMEALSQLRPVDYISWVMDDHLIRWRSGAWRYPRGIEALFAHHLKGAKRVFVISPVMAEFYQQRFAIATEVLPPPAEYENEPVWETPSGTHHCRLGYFGNLGPWAIDALNRVVSLLERCGATLDIYGPSGQKAGIFNHQGVRLCGSVPKADLRSRMRSYDAVVLPISFRPELRHMSEFNIATRMSECLASGTVTLVIGPENAAMTKFLAPFGAACLTTASSVNELRLVMKNLKCEVYRRGVLTAARNLVIQELSTATLAEKWRRGVQTLSDPGDWSTSVSRALVC